MINRDSWGYSYLIAGGPVQLKKGAPAPNTERGVPLSKCGESALARPPRNACPGPEARCEPTADDPQPTPRLAGERAQTRRQRAGGARPRPRYGRFAGAARPRQKSVSEVKFLDL